MLFLKNEAPSSANIGFYIPKPYSIYVNIHHVVVFCAIVKMYKYALKSSLLTGIPRPYCERCTFGFIYTVAINYQFKIPVLIIKTFGQFFLNAKFARP